jgi:uncharacterized protein (TIGR00369 family)
MPVPPAELNKLLSEFVPFNRFLGITVAELRDGYARLELPFRPEFIGDAARPALHGGVIATLLDTVGGFAVWTRLELDDRLSTIDLRVDYLAPALPEALVAQGTVVRIGNRVAVVDASAFSASAPDRVVATGKAVYNIKRRDE